MQIFSDATNVRFILLATTFFMGFVPQVLQGDELAPGGSPKEETWQVIYLGFCSTTASSYWQPALARRWPNSGGTCLALGWPEAVVWTGNDSRPMGSSSPN